MRQICCSPCPGCTVCKCAHAEGGWGGILFISRPNFVSMVHIIDGRGGEIGLSVCLVGCQDPRAAETCVRDAGSHGAPRVKGRLSWPSNVSPAVGLPPISFKCSHPRSRDRGNHLNIHISWRGTKLHEESVPEPPIDTKYIQSPLSLSSSAEVDKSTSREIVGPHSIPPPSHQSCSQCVCPLSTACAVGTNTYLHQSQAPGSSLPCNRGV